jgi:hypothetical protein
MGCARLTSLLSRELAAALALLACGGRTGLLEMGTEPTDARADAIVDASDLADASGAADTTATDADATCPSPNEVSAGTPCIGYAVGLSCPGNPIVCGHATFYDVLRCDGTAWVTVVPTICAIDGGA